MTPERWQQADQLLQAALEHPAEARAAFLAAACAGDAELQQEVAELLQFQQQLGDFLVTPPVRVMAEVFAAEQVERAGQLIGRYQITRALGRGGMGEVYLARDVELGRRVALKLLPERFTLDADRVSRFRQEARAASALNHPNILTIYEIGQAASETGGAHFIAAEFVEGRTLRAMIHDQELKLGQVLDIAVQTAHALAVAHAAGIIHRDIKPENLMLRPDGFVKVLDFGLAKLTERAPTTNSLVTNSPVIGFPTVETQSGVVLGTVSHMSPEQARGLEVDARSDLFSLGVVLYEMLAGCLPFAGRTASDTLAALLTAEAAPLARFVPQIPAALQNIVSRALAKEPEARYQRAAALHDDLKALRQELELTARLQPGANPLELSLGHAAQDSAEQLTPAAHAIAPRSTSRVRELFSNLTWQSLSGVRWLAFIAAAALFCALAVWGIGKYWWPARADAPITTLAVLPFTNALNDPQMEYLPDGITEGIIDNLSQLLPLHVLARSTVYSYRDSNKGHEIDPRQAGAALQVRAVVLGRVQRQGERLLVRAELVDTVDGRLLWSEQYPRPLADLRVVQQAITAEISEKLRLRLSGVQQQQLAKRQTANSEAYQLYLQGRHFLLQGTRASMEKALALYNQAIALDPNYALAHAGVADVYTTLTTQYLQPTEVIPKARQAALIAIGLDELLPEAHYALARARLFCDWDWAGAEREFKRALELNPNFDLAHSRYASLLTLQGRFAEALHEAQRARELNPLSPQASSALGLVYYFARQYDEALVHYRKVLELNPNNGGFRIYPGRALTQLGRHQEAIAELRQALAAAPQPSQRSWLAYALARAGQRDEAQALLRGLEAQARKEHVPPVYLARVYVSLGEPERALEWLRRGMAEHSDQVLNIGQEAVYDPLRGNPRFQELLRGIGLSP